MIASQELAAANQVDRLLRVLLFYSLQQDKENEDPEAWWHNQYFDLINPEIVANQAVKVYGRLS